MTASQAQEKLPDDVRNDIYAALLSGTGIRNIEETLNHEMQATGFKATLRAYINHLLRVEGVSTFPEILQRVEAKVLHDTQAAKNKDVSNGVNGVNGHSSEGDDYNLALPTSVTKEGAKTVMKELNKVCDITAEAK
ncbi:hypothetical protein SLS60_003832 [Paraconiothyrium brasiliense]|uniref:Uncharacterized protein n=1 Tax=Paraconiothyrium brasiliense TaxID=300254 RepID=A0ABR3RPS2_9PLEO